MSLFSRTQEWGQGDTLNLRLYSSVETAALARDEQGEGRFSYRMKATRVPGVKKSHMYDITRLKTRQLVVKLIKGHEMRQDETEGRQRGCGVWEVGQRASKVTVCGR